MPRGKIPYMRALAVFSVALALLAWTYFFLVRIDQHGKDYAGCLRLTANNIDNARSAAADAKREYILSTEMHQSSSAAAAHLSSSDIKIQVARNLLARVGIPASIADTPEEVLLIQAGRPDVLRARTTFCRSAYPDPQFFGT